MSGGIFKKSLKNVQFEPLDPQKPKIHEKPVVLDPTGPLESTKKVRFDPVNIWICDDLHTITPGGRFFFHRFLGKWNLQEKPSTDSNPPEKISMNPPGFIRILEI